MSTKMEQPFYHDDSFLLGYGHNDAALHDYKLQKQGMNLNLNEPYRNLKSDLYQSNSADVGSLKLASPELERLIIQTSSGLLTTPTPGQYLYSRGITDEQEGFAEGFVKALDDLHKMNHMPPPNVSIGAGGVTTCSTTASVFGSSLQSEPPMYTTLNAYCPAPSHPSATISYLPPQLQQSQHPENTHGFQHSGVLQQRYVPLKEEPQTVPDMHSSDCSPPMSPINMDNQERIKAERKRLRNRLAATKCRKRKLERISRHSQKKRTKSGKQTTMALSSMSSEELLLKLTEAGLEFSEEEKRKFKDFEVDGETVSAGLTDHMIAQLFEKSFKKQVKFIKLIQQLEENQSEEPSESLTTPSALSQEQRISAPFLVFSLPNSQRMFS